MSNTRATLRLADRKGGLQDADSLTRELNSLRGYRDVLHDTLQGLVAQTQSKLRAEEMPELVNSLDRVSVALSGFRDTQMSGNTGDSAALTQALEEAAMQRERAERAEQREREAAAVQDADRVVGALLAAAEQARDAAEQMAAQQRVGRRAAEHAHKAALVEQDGLEAALVRAAISGATGRGEAEERDAAALRSAQEALASAHDEIRRLDDRVAAADAAACAARAEANADAISLSEETTRAFAERSAAEVALSEMRALATSERRRADEIAADRDRWRQDAQAAEALIDHLRDEIRRLEQQQQMPGDAAAPVGLAPPGSRFSQYMSARGEGATSLPPGSSTPRQTPAVGAPVSAEAQPDTVASTAADGSRAAAWAVQAGPSSAAATTGGGAPETTMRSARQRGPLLRRGASG